MFLSYLFMTVLMITGILMIIVILLQRGRGGGLAGAFGGLGGQLAFGTKAGDVFTKITIGLAVFWVVLAGLSGLALERDSNRRYLPDADPEASMAPVDPKTGLQESTDKPGTATEGAATKQAEKETDADKSSKTPPPEPAPAKTGAAADQPGTETKGAGAEATKSPTDDQKPAGGADAKAPSEKPAEK